MNFEGDSVVAKYIPIDLSPYEVRIDSIDNGYHVTPTDGKRAYLPRWQDTFATKEMVGGWNGGNTGILTKFVPAIDIDILDPTAAQIERGCGPELFAGPDPCPHGTGVQAGYIDAHRHTLLEVRPQACRTGWQQAQD